MFNVGGGEFMLIALVALLVLGPDKLPDFARKSARVIGQLRAMSQGFQDEMKSVVDVDEMKDLLSGGSGTMQGTAGPRLVGPIDEGPGPVAPMPGTGQAESPPGAAGDASAQDAAQLDAVTEPASTGSGGVEPAVGNDAAADGRAGGPSAA